MVAAAASLACSLRSLQHGVADSYLAQLFDAAQAAALLPEGLPAAALADLLSCQSRGGAGAAPRSSSGGQPALDQEELHPAMAAKLGRLLAACTDAHMQAATGVGW